MVLTRAQVDNLSREELIEELLKFSDITDKLNGLNNRFEDFIKKYDELNSELLISKNCNSLLLKRITNLERNALNNAKYVRRETIEINPIPQSIPNTDLENKVCLALSLTGTTVTRDDLQACHRMKNKEKVIVKFKDRKQRNKVIFSRKELKSKGEQLRELQFGPSLFINDSMCFENQSLFYKCRQLKNVGKLFSFWFFNNTLNVKLIENGPITKIFHISDLENLLQINSIEELLNNPSS